MKRPSPLNTVCSLNTWKRESFVEVECEVTDEMMFDAGVCIGVIAGISRSLITLAQSGTGQAFACLPGRPLTNEQAARMILSHLEAHRKQLHLPGAELALNAFREAFPCR